MRRRGLPAACSVLVVGLAGLGLVGCSGSGGEGGDGGDGGEARGGGDGTAATTAAGEGPTTTVPAVTAGRLCTGAGRGTSPAEVAEAGLTEVSGVAASRRGAGVLWMHNDSGGDPEVFAVGLDGTPLGRYALEGAEATDWEDMAIGPAPGGDTDQLYLGDIGDNTSQRDGITVYRVAEPPVPGGDGEGGGEGEGGGDGRGGDRALGGVAAFTLTYADGARDAETLLADPVTGDLFVVSKQWDGAPAGVYRMPAGAEAADGTSVAMERVADAAIPEGELATGGDVSADGSLIAIRTYQSVLLWDRAPDQTVGEALAGEPCKAAATAELQGESVAFLPAGGAYVTVSEGRNPPINLFS